MNSLLQSIQDSSLADWVRVSEWGYPIILTLHSLGLALVVGVLFIIDLRIIGIPRSLPIVPMRRLMRLVWLGFTVNLITGFTLFTADAVKFYDSPTFRFKMLAVVSGVTLATILNAAVFKAAPDIDGGAARISPTLKGMAVVSILVWLAAISLGRYVAYE
jgi:hypothetical protein